MRLGPAYTSRFRVDGTVVPALTGTTAHRPASRRGIGYADPGGRYTGGESGTGVARGAWLRAATARSGGRGAASTCAARPGGGRGGNGGRQPGPAWPASREGRWRRSWLGPPHETTLGAERSENVTAGRPERLAGGGALRLVGVARSGGQRAVSEIWWVIPKLTSWAVNRWFAP